MRAAVEALVQAALEAEMTEANRRRQRRAQRDPAVVPQRLQHPLHWSRGLARWSCGCRTASVGP
jgi:hypothetical protein